MGINQSVLEKICVMFRSVSELRTGRVDTSGIWRFSHILRVWGPRIDFKQFCRPSYANRCTGRFGSVTSERV
jgi:hypothetical protein